MIAQKPPRQPIETAVPLDFGTETPPHKNDEISGLISDLGLPDGSGYEVMRRVSATRNVPGIALSGYGMVEDVRQSREAGFIEHLVKPIDVKQLVAAIHRVTQ